MPEINSTHDPKRRSFVDSANRSDSDFPLQNLPLGIFRRPGETIGRGGAAIGDRIFDIKAAREAGLFSGLAEEAAAAASGAKLNGLMALGNEAASALRARLCDLLDAAGPERARVAALADKLLAPMAECALDLPTEVGNFTDFLTSCFHSTRLSPKGALAANFMSQIGRAHV